jgi:hypothetical protein
VAQAYSFNVTVVPAGPSGFITAYPTGQSVPLAATLVWFGGALTSNAAIVPAGTGGSVDVYASAATDLVIDINGYYAPGSNGTSNTALGSGALSSNTTGGSNTASGTNALFINTTGNENTASGVDALLSNTTGSDNTASGAFALNSNTTGYLNTAIGADALYNNTTGGNNIAVGADAADNVSGGNSNNIHIGSAGASSDNNTIRIGGGQTSFFAAGIRGVTTGINNAVPVVIDSTGQLGTISSSRRFKEDIQDMGDASGGLMRLRPVTFRYQKPFDDGSKPIQYGLIAEEVADVFPDLVARSSDGQIETVKYQVLDSLLLNEVQRLDQDNRRLEERLARLEAALASLSAEPRIH